MRSLLTLALPSLALLWNPSAARADDIARALDIVQSKCFICHGLDGESATPAFPRLAAQNAAYLVQQLRNYKSGRRVSSTMQPMVADLDEADFAALGRYFASRPARAHPVNDDELARLGAQIYHHGKRDAGVPACASCHGPQGHGSDALPRLAGQHAQYTERQIRDFNTRARSTDQPIMHTVSAQLNDREIQAVAAYLSGLQ
jgi:cytochrome c553